MPRLHTVAASPRKPPVKTSGRVLAELTAADIADDLTRLRLQMQDQSGLAWPGMLEALGLVRRIGGRA